MSTAPVAPAAPSARRPAVPARQRGRAAVLFAATLLLVAGCGTAGGPTRSTAGPTPHGLPPGGSAHLPGAGPASGGPPVESSVLPGGSPSRPAPGPASNPIGWKLTDLPVFAPAPVPVRITLQGGPRAPFLTRIPTDQPVAFLTIDDGFVRTAEAPKLIAAARVPVTLFLTVNAIKADPGFFRPMLAHGAVIEDHTITHTGLRGRPYAFQRREICGSADRLGAWYGRRPVLFRPPFGNKDATTLRAAHDCGMRAVFYWKETVDKGKVRYQVGHRVRPGDIILMHFRPAFVADFLAALRAIHRAGLTPALLDDYLPS